MRGGEKERSGRNEADLGCACFLLYMHSTCPVLPASPPPVSLTLSAPVFTRLTLPSPLTLCRVWDLDTGMLRQLLRGHMGPVWCMVYDPASGRIATGSEDYTVR